MSNNGNNLTARCAAEGIGTFILVFLGCGAVHAAVLTGAQSGLWQVAVVWGIAVMLAVYIVGGISGAHINPAITIGLASWNKFPRREVGPYVAGQTGGAFLAAAALFLIYGPFLTQKEHEKGIVRGRPGSELTAMCYGEFFPNPGGLAAAEGRYDPKAHREYNALLGWKTAFVAEFLGTLLLALTAAAVTDERNTGAPAARFAPVFIGLTVAVLISVIAPLTQACLNPARDFGPRLFASLAGWKGAAFPPGLSFLTVYIAAPILGGIVGTGAYVRFLSHRHAAVSQG